MNENLKTADLKGTTFLIDIAKDQLQQADNPRNIIRLCDTHYDAYENVYHFNYNMAAKTIDLTNRSLHHIILPALGTLDPEGMARQYGKSVEEVRSMSDVYIVNSAEALDLRIVKGQQPWLFLRDVPFFVNYHLGRIEPKGYPLEGIYFDDIADLIDPKNPDYYLIPFDPAQRQCKEVDLKEILQVPKGVFPMRFPIPEILDPYGWARDNGWDIMETLRFRPVVMEWHATEVSWRSLGIHQLIKENRARRDGNRRTVPSDKPNHQKRKPR
ncbi:hypothetical protein HB364_13935 [Pseudoflavitalea sp. X16]|uniref:hypothetical protein n=1 Tax=Paraflavitalea devenefica TaxID=2716334 RepID=UPI0014232940|nr:hypothetical protein [Paraflavitalea devenefica]NII26189.1 hypothetical protein [Paraflavitalea devenefica]